jgi:hypothetical protein
VAWDQHLIAEPEGPSFISRTVTHRRLDRRCSCHTTHSGHSPGRSVAWLELGGAETLGFISRGLAASIEARRPLQTRAVLALAMPSSWRSLRKFVSNHAGAYRGSRCRLRCWYQSAVAPGDWIRAIHPDSRDDALRSSPRERGRALKRTRPTRPVVDVTATAGSRGRPVCRWRTRR